MAESQVEAKLGQLQAWVVAGLAFILVFCMSMTALMLWQARESGQASGRVEAQAEETHNALCAFKQDLKERYLSSLKILREHPEDPVQIFGLVVPRQELVNANKTRADALQSLSILDCN